MCVSERERVLGESESVCVSERERVLGERERERERETERERERERGMEGVNVLDRRESERKSGFPGFPE
jgi:hypothetical protein